MHTGAGRIDSLDEALVMHAQIPARRRVVEVFSAYRRRKIMARVRREQWKRLLFVCRYARADNVPCCGGRS